MTSNHQIVDAETLALARAGDAEALGVLWRTYQPQMLRFLRAKRSPAVDDVASAVWLDVARGVAEFDGDGRGFQRWLFTIANRRSVDERRRVARRREVTDDGLDDRWRIEHLDRFEQRDAMEQAIALVRRLPENMATAVMLRVVLDMSVADTAAIMGCTEGNARVLAHRGVTRLRAILGDADDRHGGSANTGSMVIAASTAVRSADIVSTSV